MNFKKQTLENGLTLITIPMKDNLSVTALVVVSAGSKYETRNQNGISHFLEHMCFKGTIKRPRSIDISLELDSIGSQSNAFTSQEFTGYYAKSHPNHLDKILDVVSDIYKNSTFDQKEIDKEKGVIIEEINMYEDIPQHVVHELFMNLLYGDTPSGWSVAGTKENITKMTQKDFVEYRSKHYVANATTIIISGNFDESTITSKIDKFFKDIPQSSKDQKVTVVESQTKPSVKVKYKESDQTHMILGVRTFGASDERNRVLRILNTILGSGMSSRLFQRIREDMGAGYYINSGVDKYTDHGYLAVSTGTDIKRVEEVIQAILQELKRFCLELVPESELKKAKDYLIGNIYLGLETSDSLAEYYATQEVLSKEILSPEQLINKIQSVTSEEIKTLANEIFVDKSLNLAIVGGLKESESIEKVFHF